MAEKTGPALRQRRINSLEGLRAIGWIVVFIVHFKAALAPGTVWFYERNAFLNMPFMGTGNVMVRMFLTLSGIVLSLKYFQRECYDRAAEDVVKRYFRLIPPIFVVEVVVCAMMYLGGLRHLEAAAVFGNADFLGMFNNFQPDVVECLKEALYGAFLYGRNLYVGPLWMMMYEFLGSIMVIAAATVFRRSRARFLFYIVFLAVFSGYYNYFVIGMLVSDVYVNSPVPGFLRRQRWATLLCVIAGYCLMALFFTMDDAQKLNRALFGAGLMLLMTGVMCSGVAEKVLGSRPMVFLGSISFSAYLIHWPLIESLSCAAAIALFNRGQWSGNMLLAVMLMTFAVTILLSFASKKLIEPLGNKLYGALRRWIV